MINRLFIIGLTVTIVLMLSGVFAIGSIVAGVNAQPTNFTITGIVVLNCANGKNLTLADIDKGQTCPSSNFTSPTPTPTQPIIANLTSPMVTPSASSNNTTVTPTPAVTKATMITYKDPQGRFSLSYPSYFIAEPATNRFESTLVKFDDINGGNSMSVTLITGGGTDPEVGARAVATAGSISYTLFQPVECTKYHIGQKTCSFILTKPADANSGTPGRVVMGVDTYVGGRMYALTFGSNSDDFDAALPTYEKMINSFSGGSGGMGTVEPTNNANVLH